jgi:hypothetical protein
MGAQAQHEGRQQVLELVAPAVDVGFVEQRAGGVALERLDETGVERLVDIGLDRPGPGLDHPRLGISVVRLEAERGAEGDDLAGLGVERHQVGAARPVDGRDDRVGGAKVDADGAAMIRRHAVPLETEVEVRARPHPRPGSAWP